jgi:hypothetical protein
MCPVFSEAVTLKGDCHEEILDNNLITVVFQFALNSESMIAEKDCAPSAFAGDLATSEHYGPRRDGTKKFRGSKHIERALGELCHHFRGTKPEI